MPNREDILEQQTHKGAGVDVDQRVYYTLALSGVEKSPETIQKLQLHRNTKAIAILVRHLHAAGALSDEQIDEMLLDCLS